MVAQQTERASGQTTAEEVTREEAKTAFEQVTPELPDERERKFQTPGFARMKFSWSGADAAIIGALHDMVEKQIGERFADAYAIMFELYSLVRTPEVDDQGAEVVGGDGWPEWQRTETGRYDEDWTRLTHRQRERFLFQLTTRLFEWEQTQAEGWAESMFAKGLWEQAFSQGFESIENPRATVDARTARGKIEARESHFLAIFKTYYSRRADAVVRSMQRLEQRLKDVHVTNGSR
jgi:hypothetical protein